MDSKTHVESMVSPTLRTPEELAISAMSKVCRTAVESTALVISVILETLETLEMFKAYRTLKD